MVVRYELGKYWVEYSYDYECDGAFCDAFFGFSGADWEFTPAPATAAAAPTVATTTTSLGTSVPSLD